jgi:hypothetical protein
MSTTVAEAILLTAAGYAALGMLFGIGFIFFGAGRLDPAARHGSALFRLLIWPGSAALWPVLAWRWWRAGREGGQA